MTTPRLTPAIQQEIDRLANDRDTSPAVRRLIAATPDLLRVVAVDGVEQLEDWAAQLAKWQDRIPRLQSIVAGMREVANDNRTLLARIEQGG